MKKIFVVVLMLVMVLSFAGCTEAERVGYNISQQADNFNVTRQLTIFNTRTNEMMFTMKGNFSINKEADGDLAVIGENPDNTYYKHFVFLNGDVSYVVEDVSSTAVSKWQYEININPKMLFDTKLIIVD